MGLLLHRVAAAIVLAFEAFACIASVILIIVLSAGPLYAERLPFTPAPWQWAAAFSAACALAVAAAWVKGVFDRRLPGRIGGAPHHAHISGWTFIWIVLATSVVVALASWAAKSEANRATINSEWGVAIVVGLAAAFVLAALIPTLNLADRASGAVAWVGRAISPFGRMLSWSDSVLVFAVAGAAGAGQRSRLLRYATLFGAVGACAFMGYWLEPPWGLVPLAWGFIVAVAISRRWAWVEGDRELAMLNRRFVGGHLRIGFDQDLRDLALLSFMSLLLLVPLALRQAQIAALAADFELFNADAAASADLRTWLGFFGAELAKAVPFVDWAEVYKVGGADDALIRSAISQHFVFGARILVDLVFLAALLQALAISARNATQRGLFYEGQLDRLDPFLEPREFRKLLRRAPNGALAPDAAAVQGFPAYDPIRLSELIGETAAGPLRVAACAVRAQQGGADMQDLHKELARRAQSQTRDKAAILQVVNAIRATGPERDVAVLDQLRCAINRDPNLIEVRAELVRMIGEAEDSAEKTQALVSALEGQRDGLGPVRLLALSGLGDAASCGDAGARAALQGLSRSTALTGAERRSASAMLRRRRRLKVIELRPFTGPIAPALSPGRAPGLLDPMPSTATLSEGAEPVMNVQYAEEPVPTDETRAAHPYEGAVKRLPQRSGPDLFGWAGFVALAVGGASALVLWQEPGWFGPREIAVAPRMAQAASAAVVTPALQPAATQHPPEATLGVFRDCAICPAMIRLDGGAFQMGVGAGEVGERPWEGPPREVTVPAFAIGVREVSFAEWDACAADGGCDRYRPYDREWGRGTRPVMMVSWRDAQAYVRWLSRKTGQSYRLPSEAEWEYAARGGTTGRYWWGDEFEGGPAPRQETSVAGASGPNPFGLHDVTGNVAEWVEDCYVNTYSGAPSDGRPRLDGDCARRVVRGGSWRSTPLALRVSARVRLDQSLRDASVGFRVVRAVD